MSLFKKFKSCEALTLAVFKVDFIRAGIWSSLWRQ